MALVKVIEARPLSLWLADELGVAHASPQVILIDGGRAMWNASHGAIRVDALQRAITL